MRKRNLSIMFVFITILLSYISTTGLALDLPLELTDPEDDVIKFTLPLTSEFVSVDYIDIVGFSITEKDEDNSTIKIEFNDFTDFPNYSMIMINSIIGEFNFSLEDVGVILGGDLNDSEDVFNFKIARMDINETNDVDWEITIDPVGVALSYDFSVEFSDVNNYIEFDLGTDELPTNSTNYLVTSLDLFLSFEEILPETEEEWIEFMEEFEGGFSPENLTDVSLYFDYLSDSIFPLDLTSLSDLVIDPVVLIIAVIGTIIGVGILWLVLSLNKKRKTLNWLCESFKENPEEFKKCKQDKKERKIV
jgi:hypothetical protein